MLLCAKNNQPGRKLSIPKQRPFFCKKKFKHCWFSLPQVMFTGKCMIRLVCVYIYGANPCVSIVASGNMFSQPSHNRHHFFFPVGNFIEQCNLQCLRYYSTVKRNLDNVASNLLFQILVLTFFIFVIIYFYFIQSVIYNILII